MCYVRLNRKKGLNKLLCLTAPRRDEVPGRSRNVKQNAPSFLFLHLLVNYFFTVLSFFKY